MHGLRLACIHCLHVGGPRGETIRELLLRHLLRLHLPLVILVERRVTEGQVCGCGVSTDFIPFVCEFAVS